MHYVVLWSAFKSEGWLMVFSCLNKQINKLSLFSWLSKQADLEGRHSFILCFICGGPCHPSSFKQGSGDLIFPLRTACLFTYGKYKYWISAPKLQSAPLKSDSQAQRKLRKDWTKKHKVNTVKLLKSSCRVTLTSTLKWKPGRRRRRDSRGFVSDVQRECKHFFAQTLKTALRL